MSEDIENYLENEIDRLTKQAEGFKLLRDIYLELGPYTPHLPWELKHRMQVYFNFDDSE